MHTDNITRTFICSQAKYIYIKYEQFSQCHKLPLLVYCTLVRPTIRGMQNNVIFVIVNMKKSVIGFYIIVIVFS